MAIQTAVVYFTKGGAAEIYANAIADELAGFGHVVDIINLRQNDPSDLAAYDNVVVGTGVRIGMVYRRAKRFLKRDDLKDKRLAIFLASGIAIDEPERSEEKFLEPLIKKYGLNPVKCDAFPGYVPGADEDSPETVDPTIARAWAVELAKLWC